MADSTTIEDQILAEDSILDHPLTKDKDRIIEDRLFTQDNEDHLTVDPDKESVLLEDQEVPDQHNTEWPTEDHPLEDHPEHSEEQEVADLSDLTADQLLVEEA